jgi:hypothetical protein
MSPWELLQFLKYVQKITTRAGASTVGLTANIQTRVPGLPGMSSLRLLLKFAVKRSWLKASIIWILMSSCSCIVNVCKLE